MSSHYRSLASLYDGLMAGVDYQHWAGYLHRLIAHHGAPGHRLLDLGCGTGNLALPLSRLGYHVIGVDLSPEMLAIAADKGLAANMGLSRWRCQDMRQLRFPQDSFDLAVCACDGINYLASGAELQQTLQGLAACLASGGLLLFDLHSEYKLQHVFDGGLFVQECESGYCVWGSQFEQESGDCWHELTIFLPAGDGLYRRYNELHRQHYFSLHEVTAALTGNGFELLDFCAWGTQSAPAADTERWQVVARRTGE
ncbi:MAG: class I SAM-dependent DNA methyltransferase [Bacillota bacterium]|jgi:SAM-dependent methyltransferase